MSESETSFRSPVLATLAACQKTSIDLVALPVVIPSSEAFHLRHRLPTAVGLIGQDRSSVADVAIERPVKGVQARRRGTEFGFEAKASQSVGSHLTVRPLERCGRYLVVACPADARVTRKPIHFNRVS